MNIKALTRAAIAAMLTSLSMATVAGQPASRIWEFAYILKIDAPEDYSLKRELSQKQIAENKFSHLHPEVFFLLQPQL